MLIFEQIPTAAQPIYGTEIEIGIPIKPEPENQLQFHLEPDLDQYNIRPKTPNTNPFLDDYEPPPEVPVNSHTSEGSITPTNPDPMSGWNSGMEHSINNTTAEYGVTGSRRPSTSSGKTPPPAPVRRTSSISNPNAITLGTLKSHYGNLEELKNKQNISLYDEIGVLTKSMNDINNSLKNTDFSGPSTPIGIENNIRSAQEYRRDSMKNMFENYQHPGPGLMSKTNSQDEPLPAPPPEAFIEHASSNNNYHNNHVSNQQIYGHHHNPDRIANVHREFLEQLNSKLAQPAPIYEKTISTAVVKPRRSQSSSRSGSRKNSQDKGLVGNFRDNFLDRLQATLSQKPMSQQNPVNEIAKQAACAASQLQRKQSVPDLNETQHSHYNNGGLKQRQFSSQLNLSDNNNGDGMFQVVQINTNSTQQPIYASRAQLRREIQELYGTIGTSTYGSSAPERDPTHFNGFWNKVLILGFL